MKFFQATSQNTSISRVRVACTSFDVLIIVSGLYFEKVCARQYFRSLHSSAGQLAIERLGKEKAEFGLRYVNLLSTAQIPMVFRKQLTCPIH